LGKQEIKQERKLSVTNVWAVAFGCIIGWSGFVLPGTSFLKNAGTLGTAIGMGIAALVMIIIAFNYNYMVNKFPRSGGEFVYSNEAFGKKSGFVCSWFLSLSYLVLVPLNATGLPLVAKVMLGDFFQFGFHYQVAGYEVYLGEILLSMIALAVFAILSIIGVKFSGVFQTVIAALLAGGVLVVGIAALISDKSSVSNLMPLFAPEKTKCSSIEIRFIIAIVKS
jgi:amino acid transporter